MKDEVKAGELTIGGWSRWLPVMAWIAVIFVVSAQPTLPLPTLDWLAEVIRIGGHFFEYAVLGFLVSRATANGEPSPMRLALALAACALYAISDEWHQGFVPGRDASLFDVMVDVIGAVAGSMVYRRRMKDEG
jgi:VanZ family protein